MNKRENQSIRLSQLNPLLSTDQPLQSVQRPVGGWLRAVRQALGRSLKSVADDLDLSPQAIHQLEKSEAAGTISLKQLELAADAMGCRVIYTLIPREGSLTQLAESHGPDAHQRTVRHSMALEGQHVPPPSPKV